MKYLGNPQAFAIRMGGGDFGVYSFTGREAVSQPYCFDIELVSTFANVDVIGLVGQPASLSITDRSGGERLVHGLIREMRQLHTANKYTHYSISLVPRLWFLKETSNHRIFQEKAVPDIITEILEEQGFSGEAFSFKCLGSFEPREYCVQYGESDFHFISRLCEEEGIYYFHEHTGGGHCLTFCNMPGGPPIEGESNLRYFPGSGNLSDTSVIARLNLHGAIHSNEATYREWNFEKPNLDLEVNQKEDDSEKAPVPAGMKLETYQYPHLYKLQGPGKNYAEIQMLRQITFARWIECESDVSRFLPASVFTVFQHPKPEANAEWWITEVRHYGEQPGVLEHEAPSDRGLQYNATVRAIPSQTRFVPPLRHPKNRVVGEQTAIVTGPEGEEIYPDKYGRVKVQFFWDRLDQWNEKTTCWIRVSQGWAGPAYGMMTIPRIGHEVIVSFMEGDPDRPIITGRVYHALNMPPYELPEHKTRTVFKSMSTPGEEEEERGFNEFRIEDKKGEEEIYIHAEKDVNIHVKNDWKEHVFHDKHETIGASRYTAIQGEEHLIIEKPRKIELKDEDHLIVHQDSHAEYKTKWLVKTGEEIHFKSGDKVVIEAGSDLTIKAGGSFIRLNPSGITIMGSMVKINEGGAPGSGTGASPACATQAIGVDPSGKPIAPEIRKGEEVERQGPILYFPDKAGLDRNSKSLQDVSEKVKDLIEKSPTLVSQLNDNPNLIIEGSLYTTSSDIENNIIYLQDGSAEELVESLAHELGHINGPPIESSSKEAFVGSSLRSEGAATINSIKVRREILKETGIDIASRFDERDSFYESVYDELLSGSITEETAYEKIGEFYGDNEVPGSGICQRQKLPYRECYSRYPPFDVLTTWGR